MFARAAAQFCPCGAVIIILLFTGCNDICAREADSVIQIGLGLNAGPSFHHSNIATFDAPLPNMLEFSDAVGIDYQAWLLAEYPLANGFRAGARLGFSRMGSVFEVDEATVFSVNGVATPGLVRHAIDASFNRIGVTPYTELRIQDVGFFAGFCLGGLVGSAYEQSQRIVEPDAVEFEPEGGKQRITSSGAVPFSAGWLFSGVLGLSYNVGLDDEWNAIIRPRLELHYSFNSSLNNADWKSMALYAGAEVLYALRKDPVVLLDTIYQRDTTMRLVIGAERNRTELANRFSAEYASKHGDTIRHTTRIFESYDAVVAQPRPLLTGSIQAHFLLADTIPADDVVIKVSESVENTCVNLLPYVFFDEHSSDIPERYFRLDRREAASFNIEALNGVETLRIYYHLLNVIGRRLQDNPAADLTLHCCNSDPGTVRQRRELARERGETIATYLRDVWAIEPERIDIKVRYLPANPSPTNNEFGAAENRRVELTSRDTTLLRPLFVSDTVFTAAPSIVRFRQQVVAEAGLAQWNIRISNTGNGMETVKVLGGRDSLPVIVDWDINADEEILSDQYTELSYELAIRDKKDFRESISGGTLEFIHLGSENPGKNQGPDKTIHKYSLMSFDYDLFALSKYHYYILNLARNSIGPRSTVHVIGSTDFIGEEEYNLSLSQRRAETIAERLNLKNANVRGIGEDLSSFPNELPEGRFYNRRVDIVIEEWKR